MASWLHNTEHSAPAVAVFSGSQPGACGQAVSKPVDNRRQMRITTRSPWIHLWIAEKPEMAGGGLLRGSREGSRNVLTVRKRASPGGDPGNVGGAGRPAPRTGTRPRRAARCASKARQLASRCGEAGQGPSISYMEGPCLILPGPDVLAGTVAARGNRRKCATATVRSHDRVRARSLAGCGTWRSTGSPRRVPARGRGNAGRTVTGRGARADRDAG